MKRILAIEDESSLLEMIQFNLELEGYSVTTCATGNEALSYSTTIDDFDLVILDVMLPHVSGLDICRAYRETSEVPILFLSAKGTTIDRVAGLKLGANDYLPKPFDLEELLLRVQALTRSKSTAKIISSTLHIGNFEVDFQTFYVNNSVTNQQHLLTKREIELLQLFQERQNTVVSRDEILSKLWGADHVQTGRTIDNYILNFRKIFEKDPKNPVFFHSIRGVGYKFSTET